jgi:hypothetical protein
MPLAAPVTIATRPAMERERVGGAFVIGVPLPLAEYDDLSLTRTD